MKPIIMSPGIEYKGQCEKTLAILERVLAVNEKIVSALMVPPILQTDFAVDENQAECINKAWEKATNG